jgi:hypothetical protein
MIGKALAHHWKLKALESIEMSAGASFPVGELTQLINALIDNHQIKDIIMISISVCSTKEDTKMPMVSAVVGGTQKYEVSKKIVCLYFQTQTKFLLVSQVTLVS